MTFNYLYMSGGAAAGDFNNDGLTDLYFASTMEANKLYLNKGGFQFEDISEKAGIGGPEGGIKTGVALADVNGDGKIDILLAGNDYGPAVETNRYDAGNGALLLGDGKGAFSFLPNHICGFWAMREARNMAFLKMARNKVSVVIANNSSAPQLYLKHGN